MQFRAGFSIAGAVLAVNLSGAVRADITFLNQFAPLTAGFQPWYVGTGPNGQVIVTDNQDSVGQFFGPDGSYEGTLTKGAFIGISNPTFGVVGPDGDYYVSDAVREGIVVFGANGVEQSIIVSNNYSGFAGIAASPFGTIYATSGKTMYVYSTSGQLESSFSESNSSGSISQIALDSAGSDVYLADSLNNVIDVYSASGTPEGTFGSASGPGQLQYPYGVAISGSGLVYVSDQLAGIKVFSLNGTYIGTDALTVNGQAFHPYSLAVSTSGMVYATATNVSAVYRFFDPASWTAGTNNFTNANTGPTSVAIGSGQLLGSTLTLNSNMGLNVGATTAVNNGGVFTLTGGALSTNTLALDGTTNGASFTMTSGSLSATTISISNGGVADFVGSPLSVALAGSVSVNDASSQFKVDQGATFSATSLSNAGQVYVGSNSDFIVYSATSNGGTVNLGGGELDIRGTFTNSSTETIQGAGTLSTTLGLTNSGTVALAGSSNVLGPVTNAGTIHLSGTQPNIFFGAVSNTGAVNIDAGASGTFYGSYTGNGSINNMGAVYFDANSISGPITGGGILNLGQSNVAASLQIAHIGTSLVSSLNLSAGSTLDLDSSDMIVTNGSLGQIAGLLAAGFDKGTWRGDGIYSSAAAVDGATAIGYASASSLGITQFDTQSVSANDILLKYTWIGDANLDGVVNAADLALMISSGTSWSSGDFNYDGKVNADDFSLFMLGAAASGGGNISNLLPEPVMGVWLLAFIISNQRRQRMYA